jgi:hypothetical protein
MCKNHCRKVSYSRNSEYLYLVSRRAFSVDVVELAKGILLIVESLVMEANESDIGITDSVLTISNDLVMLPVSKLQK